MAIAEITQLQGNYELPNLASVSPGEFEYQQIDGHAQIARADVPWNLYVPEEVSGTVIIAHGYFGKGRTHYDELAKFIASHGFAAGVYDTPNNQRLLSGWNPKHLLEPSRLVNQALWATVRDIRQRDDIDIPDSAFETVGHSQGGRTIVENALRHPDFFNSTILVDSAGLEGKNLLSMVGRLPSFLRKELEISDDEMSDDNPDRLKLLTHALSHIVSNPLRTAAEGVSIAEADITNILSRLALHTATVVSPQDNLVNPGAVTERSGGLANTHVVLPRIDGKRLGHLGPVRHPAIYGTVVISLLEHFNKTNASPAPIPSGLALAA